MIKTHAIIVNHKGETQEHIDICQYCTLPAKKCNGECERYKKEAQKLKMKKHTKKTIIVY